jgi:protein-S-isoprenylcysteine O-methyltransferase Ste14
MTSLHAGLIRSTLISAVVAGALIFIPAGTLSYWQGWVFIAVFDACSIGIGVYLAIHDPALLARRKRVGPQAETDPAQKIIMSLAVIGFIALIVVPALDYRFMWTPVPAVVALFGDGLIALGFFLVFLVFRENTFGASTIRVEENQRVIDTGPYAHMRHPMYAAALVMLAGIPLALGSWGGLFIVLLFVPILAWRLLAEERYLAVHLPGYADYMRRVRWRLLPGVW